jgi:hypothetical protein
MRGLKRVLGRRGVNDWNAGWVCPFTMSYWCYQSCWLGDSNIGHHYQSIPGYSIVLKVRTEEAFLMKSLSCFYSCLPWLTCLLFLLFLVLFEHSSSTFYLTKDHAKALEFACLLDNWNDSKQFHDGCLYFSFRNQNKMIENLKKKKLIYCKGNSH